MANAVGSMSNCRSRGHEFEPQRITLLEIDHEIISTAIFPLLLIREGHLSMTGKSMCTK